MQMQIEITGVVPSKFTMDGYSEDCVKVSGLIPLDVDKGGKGRGAEIFDYKNSDAIKEFENVDFSQSQLADCTVELVKSGKKSKLILRSVKFKSVVVKA